MLRKPREVPARFTTGDKVNVRDNIATRFIGQVGTITEIRLSVHAHTLDKYSVRFISGEESMFWDIQLEKHCDALSSHGG